MLDNIKKELQSLANPIQAAHLQRFFKTGKGEYGYGDIFLGIRVPVQRVVAKKYSLISIGQLKELLHSKIHEFRFCALLILISKFKKGGDEIRKEIYDFYLENLKWVNNWDLVDVSAHIIVGWYLLEKPKKILYSLISSDNLWERRVAMVSTLAFIRKGDFIDTVKLSERLLGDKQDLIHKASGWMLREMGKRSIEGEDRLIAFLDKNAAKMPRTMLRYAIEKLPEERRRYYLARK